MHNKAQKKKRGPKSELKAELPPEGLKAAKHAGLRYVTDLEPGIERKPSRSGFTYLAENDRTIRDRATLSRIKSLAIPPAWLKVWICRRVNGHLQATGRDARGRKQYRYHAKWRETRDKAKYDNLIAFARALPRIRKQVSRHLGMRGLPRKKVLAAIVRLLETTLIRVGNDEYATENKSFGLTTLRDRHVRIRRGKVHFEFRGKSGIEHEIDLSDRRLARIVQDCQDLPGQELFGYLDENGDQHDVGSTDVNDYLREITGQDFTAKDFRTWAGTALAAQALQEFEDFDSKAAAKRNITQAIERVAGRLGNTKAVCRKCYVHPAIIDAYLQKTLVETLQHRTEAELRHSIAKLPPEEAAVLALLQQRMERKVGSRSRK